MKKYKFISLILSCALLMVSFTSCVAETIEITEENAKSILDSFKIGVRERALVEGKIPEATGDGTSGPVYELPDVTNYDLSVKGNGEIDVEVFLPIEDSGSSILEFVSYVAKGFNEKGVTVDGKKASVSVRALEASLAEEYILNGNYYPKGYIAANELYGLLMKENGINVSMVSEKTIANTMGIVISKSKFDELKTKYGEVTIQTIVKANLDGEIKVGYPNPTNNPTGLNFVISMLSYFDEGNPLSFEATTDFSAFQSSVAQVSFDTKQMKASVENGTLDAFIMEHQAFSKDESLSYFEFMPFGTRHDNPLYAVGNVSESENEVLKAFAEYFKENTNQDYGKQLGFGQNASYQSTVKATDGTFVTTVIELWKEQRANAGNISVIFVADVSGSMDGDKIENLKNSLLNAMQYIGEKTRVGLLSFNGYVFKDLGLAEFNTQQQKYFAGAVENLDANGGTATNDGLIVATKMLVSEVEENSGTKPLIFLLSDGHTGSGYSFSSVKDIIDYYDIPIYTIGYGNNADEHELAKIAELNSGTFIKANSDDISYIIKTLFNAET